MTIAKQFNITEFPFIIRNKARMELYYEDLEGFWIKSEYDSQGNHIYFEDSDGDWDKREYDSKGKQTYFEDSDGFWWKQEYDSKGNMIYWENSGGLVLDNRGTIEYT